MVNQAYLLLQKFETKTIKVYLCSLLVEKFDILLLCLLPCSYTIKQPKCKSSGIRAIDKATEPLSVMTVCRHDEKFVKARSTEILNNGKFLWKQCFRA